MTNAILMGSNKVTENEVFSVPAVPYTRSFHPIHHRDFIQAVKEGIHGVGLEITKAEYVLAAEGKRMFGVYSLNQGNSDMCWSLGIRNSMDKSVSLGITCGTKVFVCENLSFSGEFVAFRRHTSGLDVDELAFLAFRAMRTIVPRLKRYQQWHEGLRNYPLTEKDLRVLLVEIMANNVIPASKFHRFNDLYATVYDDSLYGLHEAVTDVLRGSNLMTLPQKNKLLNGVLNSYIDSLDTAQSSALGDFYQQRAAYR